MGQGLKPVAIDRGPVRAMESAGDDRVHINRYP